MRGGGGKGLVCLDLNIVRRNKNIFKKYREQLQCKYIIRNAVVKRKKNCLWYNELVYKLVGLKK
jgi:hypothetical protein